MTSEECHVNIKKGNNIPLSVLQYGNINLFVLKMFSQLPWKTVEANRC